MSVFKFCHPENRKTISFVCLFVILFLVSFDSSAKASVRTGQIGRLAWDDTPNVWVAKDLDAIRAYDKLYQAKLEKQVNRYDDTYEPTDDTDILAATPPVKLLANQHRLFTMPLGTRVQAIEFVPRVGLDDPNYKAPDYTSTVAMDMYYSEGYWRVKILDGPRKGAQLWTIAVVTLNKFSQSPSYSLAYSSAGNSKPLDVVSSIDYDTNKHDPNQSIHSVDKNRTVYVHSYVRHSRNGGVVSVHSYRRSPPSR